MYLLKPFITILSTKSLIFTFHHVSIKTVFLTHTRLAVIWFTFHHVSIKTELSLSDYDVYYLFTFHHVSIKTRRQYMISIKSMNSHSTMYLLKPIKREEKRHQIANSHSTMYLLKRNGGKGCYSGQCNSHSTMYLLKREASKYYEFALSKFTFHHVSIKTHLLRREQLI